MLTEPPFKAALLFQAIRERAESVALDLGAGDLKACITVMAGLELVVLCFDYDTHHGSIGVAEASQLQAALNHSRHRGCPLVLLIESSGIRVTDGTAGIASLRRVMRDVMDARWQGVRLLAMVTRCAFGGASLLACACERQYMYAHSLLSMSGPKLIQQQAGIAQFNASDATAVNALLSGAARAATSPNMMLVEAKVQAYLKALESWLIEAPPPVPDLQGLRKQLSTLCARLKSPLSQAQPLSWPSPWIPSHASELLLRIQPAPHALLFCEKVWMTQAHVEHTRVLGLMTPQGCSARDALALVRALLQPALSHTKRTVVLVDAPGHAANPEDEEVVFSEVLALLSLTLRCLHRQGLPVEVVVSGSGGGGIQAALAAGASSVAMGPQAHLYVLPKAAMQALNKAEDEQAGTLATALATGAVDRAFEG